LKRAPMPPPPSGVLRASTAELPPPLKRFREGVAPVAEGTSDRAAEPVPRIAFPPDRAEIEVDEDDGGSVRVKAEGGALPLTWLLEGEPIASDPARREAELPAGRRGFFRLSVIDARGRTDRVTVRLK
jgi:penicillin-binding protein 1C